MKFKRTIAFALLILVAGSIAARAADAGFGMRLFSAMGFIKDEGEYYGLQVALVPYSESQTLSPRLKIFWRSAGGWLNPPLVLDVARDGAAMKVVVPDADNDFSGEWVLSLDGKVLHARGPGSQHFDLKEVPLR